jgi:LmbE family N-acetylglucosaminyl deacetylase
MTKCVLVVAAHADDEALGCGGTIARHVEAGDRVEVVFVADGVSSRPGSGDEDLARRFQATSRAQQILGITKIRFLGLPDNRLDSVPLLDIVQSLEAVIAEVNPTIVYTHHVGDLNVDHRMTHQAVMTACRPLPSSTVREILAFEVLSSTEWGGTSGAPFIPNYFVDVSSTLATKLRALDAYSMEMRESPHSRSIVHVASLARHRGHSVGVDAAEAFMVIRRVKLFIDS